jgi:hypothetical protein
MSEAGETSSRRCRQKGVELPKYTHYPLNEEIRSIGGYYKVLQEGILDFEGKKILYALKGAHADTACCGPGGMGLISVAGYIVAWKSEKNEDGLAVSEVKHVTDREVRKRLKVELKKKIPYIDVVEFD